MIVYQDILNIFNLDPTNDITNDRRKSLIQFKVCLKYLNWPSSLCLVNVSCSDSHTNMVNFQPKNPQVFILLSFKNIILTLWFPLFSIFSHYPRTLHRDRLLFIFRSSPLLNLTTFLLRTLCLFYKFQTSFISSSSF